MNVITKLKRGEGSTARRLKRWVRDALSWHLPVNGLTRPLFKCLYVVHVLVRESWIWSWRFFWNEPLFRSQCESIGSRFQIEQLPYLQGQGRIILGDDVRFSGKPQFAFNNQHDELPELRINDGTFLGHHCTISVARSVEIGRHCLLASGVSIADYDGHPLDPVARRQGATSPKTAIHSVVIGDDVWIGAGATILKGVHIGDRAIVAARAVVTKDVPTDCIVAGNPARVVRRLTMPDELAVPIHAEQPIAGRSGSVSDLGKL
jgi:acetyltransferase-like isoleucine patch superfamily enzyme